MKVLVVDDEPLARRKLSVLLAEVPRARQVGEACDGLEALEAVARLRPDVVFLDIQMPEVSGIEVLERLRASHPAPAVVFTTAHDQYAITAFELQAIDYLLKPSAASASGRRSSAPGKPRPCASPSSRRGCRMHRSHIVNLDCVERMKPLEGSRLEVLMRDGARVPVSRMRAREIRRQAR
jgi:DNA-binding LytR/AlgR family response regulator